MTLDGLTLHHIVEELAGQLTGCKIDRIHQPQPDTLILSLRSPGRNIKLLMCSGAGDSRMHITEQKYTNPGSPPVFCMFLRKHITGAKITAIEQIGLERIVNITLETKDEIGLPRLLVLTAELMGKYSNIILKDKNEIILDSLRHISQLQSRVRSVLPSLKYELPKSNKLNPLMISETTLVEMLEKRGNKNIKTYLSQLLQGVSRQTAEEILYRYMPSGYEKLPKEAQKLAGVISEFFNQRLDPTLYMHKAVPFFYSPFKYMSVTADSKEAFAGANDAVDQFYKRQNEIKIFSSKRERLTKLVTKRLDKHTSLLQKQFEAIEHAKKADEYKNKGDIITANIYRIKKGMASLAAQDYMTGEQILIDLNPRLSPSANAQANYKKYAKLKAGLDITIKRMNENKREIYFLESVQLALDSSENIDELGEIEFELIKNGVISAKAVKNKAVEKPSSPHSFVSSDGYVFYAGKNNRQNDTLTTKTASPGDLWLHTKDIPGSHVVVTGIKSELPDSTLFEAATIAATLSKAKNSSKVPVDYTRIKNVHKPSGARPGYVIYENYKTIIVDPDRELFEKLLNT
jgi:predicted ribosome quality control (RQC) complex YloA/Tae2 family protein